MVSVDMAEDDTQIQIRCPQCGQRFRVGHELRGRMVECGACEHRFRVDDDILIKQKKFYPGERKDPQLAQFARKPHMEVRAPQHMQTASYAEAPETQRFEPVGLGKVLVGIAGASFMALILLILLVSGRSGGMLDGVPSDRRIVIALFAAVVGTAMIVYANPRARFKALVFALMGSTALLLAPMYFKDGAKTLGSDGGSKTIDTAPVVLADTKVNIDKLKQEIGYGPMESAMLGAGTKGKVLGVWIKDLHDSNAQIVKSYLLRISGAGEESHLYPRMDRNYLLVLINPDLSLEELSMQCGRLGRVDRVVDELNLIEATVSNEKFAERPIGKMNDKTDGAFYQLNLLELEGMDIKRINDALLRLSLAEPVQSRDDVIKRMIELLKIADREMLENLSKALLVWSDGKDGAPAAVLAKAKSFYKEYNDLPVDTMKFLTNWRVAEAYPILDALWMQGATIWEEVYLRGGEPAEAFIVKHFEEGSNSKRMSAARIAARVGGEASIRALTAAMEVKADDEIRTSFKNAIESIRARAQ